VQDHIGPVLGYEKELPAQFHENEDGMGRSHREMTASFPNCSGNGGNQTEFGLSTIRFMFPDFPMEAFIMTSSS
jgi:hypothetical protein